jgi:uncharacterized membrane protein
MSDASQGNHQPPVPTGGSGNLMNSPQLVYLLYLGGFILAILPLIGVVLAFVNRDSAAPMERTHYDYQISTFWRGLVIGVVGVVLIFVLVGWLVLLFAAVWMIVRCVKGLNKFSQKEPMAANIGWGFG